MLLWIFTCKFLHGHMLSMLLNKEITLFHGKITLKINKTASGRKVYASKARLFLFPPQRPLFVSFLSFQKRSLPVHTQVSECFFSPAKLPAPDCPVPCASHISIPLDASASLCRARLYSVSDCLTALLEYALVYWTIWRASRFLLILDRCKYATLNMLVYPGKDSGVGV